MRRPTTPRSRLEAVALALALAAAAPACADDAQLAMRCQPGARTCDGSDVLVCDPVSATFVPERHCPIGAYCYDGRCIPNPAGGADTSDVSDVPGNVDDAFDDATLDTSAPPDTTAPADTQTAVPETTASNDTATAADTSGPADTATTPPDSVGSADSNLADTADTSVPADTARDDAAAPGPHGPLVYQKVPQSWLLGDLRLVRWHPDGDWALMPNPAGDVLRYDAGARTTALVGRAPGPVTDIVADPAGAWFLLAGITNAGAGRLWRVDLDADGALRVLDTIDVPYGRPLALALLPDSSPARVAVGTSAADDSVSWLYTWDADGGLSAPKGVPVSAGLTGVTWSHDALHGGPNVLAAFGRAAADSRAWILGSDTLVGTNWPASFGRPGCATWRPGGSWGALCGWSSGSNQLYVYDGAWRAVAAGASPQAIGWRGDGGRALAVGKALAGPARATVVEIDATAGEAWSDAVYTDRSIAGWDQAPWFGLAPGASAQLLLGVDWRPSACDEGLIVGTDTGTSSSPTFATVLRFYDDSDPDCHAAATVP